VFGYPTTFRSRITELEQTENWVDVLTEYGSLQFKKPEMIKSQKCVKNGIHTDLDLTLSMTESEIEKDGRDGREGNVIDMTLDSPLSGQAVVRVKGRGQGDGRGGERDGRRDPQSTGVTVNSAAWRRESEDAKQDEDEGQEVGEEEEDGAWSQSAELERGRLRCLLELGHLDAIVDQVGPVCMRCVCCILMRCDGVGWDGMGWDGMCSLRTLIAYCTLYSRHSPISIFFPCLSPFIPSLSVLVFASVILFHHIASHLI
jgi:hypothetical protein